LLDFLCFWWPWQCWAQYSSILQDASLSESESVWCFSSDYIGVIGFSEKDSKCHFYHIISRVYTIDLSQLIFSSCIRGNIFQVPLLYDTPFSPLLYIEWPLEGTDVIFFWDPDSYISYLVLLQGICFISVIYLLIYY
jgi:hypothetical protein